MKILRARLALPARLKPTAVADARRIAEAIAHTLSARAEAGGGTPGRLTIEIQGNGRPAAHMRHDLTTATGRALRARAWRS